MNSDSPEQIVEQLTQAIRQMRAKLLLPEAIELHMPLATWESVCDAFAHFYLGHRAATVGKPHWWNRLLIRFRLKRLPFHFSISETVQETVISTMRSKKMLPIDGQWYRVIIEETKEADGD